MPKSLTQRAREIVRRKRPRTLTSVIEEVSGSNGDAEDAEFQEAEAPEESEGAAIRREEETALKPIDQERAAQLAPYSDGLPFEKERVKQRILDCGANILEQMVNIGKYLIWAKEELGHGSFLPWIEAELGMSQQRAGEFMRMAQRVIESKSPHVRWFLQQAAGESKKKLLALLDVSDEEVAEVMETETFLGKRLDEVEAMSYRQLQEALRGEQKRNLKLLKKGEELERKVDALQVEVESKQVSDRPPDETAFTILDRAFASAIEKVGILQQVALEYAEELGDEALMEPETRQKVNAYLGQINQSVTALSTILVPDQIAGLRVHIPIRPKTEDGGPEFPSPVAGPPSS